MKSFKLVVTGTAILMCTMFVSIKITTGSVEQLVRQTSAGQQEIAAQQAEEEDNILVYPSCLPAVLPYQ